jgi:hypothetical protein
VRGSMCFLLPHSELLGTDAGHSVACATAWKTSSIDVQISQRVIRMFGSPRAREETLRSEYATAFRDCG